MRASIVIVLKNVGNDLYLNAAIRHINRILTNKLSCDPLQVDRLVGDCCYL